MVVRPILEQVHVEPQVVVSHASADIRHRLRAHPANAQQLVVAAGVGMRHRPQSGSEQHVLHLTAGGLLAASGDGRRPDDAVQPGGHHPVLFLAPVGPSRRRNTSASLGAVGAVFRRWRCCSRAAAHRWLASALVTGAPPIRTPSCRTPIRPWCTQR